MIIRIEKSGGSFRGAGLYYLHDKAADRAVDRALKPKTDERVWFTDTRNCVETDPERALNEMWQTAEDQNVLKREAGVRTSGRACENPVKTISLSWHPDHRVTPEHMIQTADAFLKHMGWHDHQAVYVAHRDTKHPHIHIILNRVHPETGRTLDDYREQKRAKTWRLEYERVHERWREKARDTRSPRQPDARQHEQGITQEQGIAIPQPANDHLPHNVIMISRPHELEFQAHEALRAGHDVIAEKAELKLEQREERQQFFKDGAELFKATRHAVYDEVRQEYRPEWAALYKEAQAAEQSAEAASQTALSRAFHFAKSGQWEKATDAFGDRDSVRDAVAEEFKMRFAELKDRQMLDLRERQAEACDALRDIRDVQYQDLLQRQRDERAAFNAGQTVGSIRLEHHGAGRIDEAGSPSIEAVNQNEAARARRPDVELSPAPVSPYVHGSTEIADERRALDIAAAKVSPEQVTPVVGAAPVEPANVTMSVPEAPEVTRQLSDLAAGSIGSVASYLADQLGEMFAPTPPEVREAQAKEEAKREADKPAPAPKDNAYEKLIAAAVSAGEAQQAAREQAWWQDRDRGKGWERDQ